MGKARDLATGAVLIAIGIAMTWTAAGFPQIAAVTYGPDLFPRVIAGGLILSGLGVLLEVWRGVAPEPDATEYSWLPMLILAGLIAAYAVLMPILGFHIATALALLVAVRLFGGGAVTCIAVAVLGPLVLHYIFYSVLRVSLPWGLLTPVAW